MWHQGTNLWLGDCPISMLNKAESFPLEGYPWSITSLEKILSPSLECMGERPPTEVPLVSYTLPWESVTYAACTDLSCILSSYRLLRVSKYVNGLGINVSSDLKWNQWTSFGLGSFHFYLIFRYTFIKYA